ncbi:hypothetical protein MLD38_018627 [Melastoma candidum]|uniref:Uncharacterized protein n=1 Tax=Melastoma candidum TaxID=119954 RepID=A0ACB9QUD4_9MYRT|nr:hypothetical protein MLD38_018627 [Melastoma candidum]
MKADEDVSRFSPPNKSSSPKAALVWLLLLLLLRKIHSHPLESDRLRRRLVEKGSAANTLMLGSEPKMKNATDVDDDVVCCSLEFQPLFRFSKLVTERCVPLSCHHGLCYLPFCLRELDSFQFLYKIRHDGFFLGKSCQDYISSLHLGTEGKARTCRVPISCSFHPLPTLKMDQHQQEGSDLSLVMVNVASTDQVPYASPAYQPGPVTGSPNFVNIAQPMVQAGYPIQPNGAQFSYQPGPVTGSPNLMTMTQPVPVVGAAHLIQPRGVPGAPSSYQLGPVSGSPNLMTMAQQVAGYAQPVQPHGAPSAYQSGPVTGSPNLMPMAQPVVGAAQPVQPTGGASAYLPGPVTGSPNLMTMAQPAVGAAQPVQPTGGPSPYQPGPVTGTPNFVTISQPMVQAGYPIQPTGEQYSYRPGPVSYRPGPAVTGSPNLMATAQPRVGAAHPFQQTGAPSTYQPGPARGSENLVTIARPVVGNAHSPTGGQCAYLPGTQPVVGAVHTVQPTGAQFAQYQLCQQYQQQQQQQQLQEFWAKQREECLRVTDFRNHSVPLARIKRIMKADEDVKMVAAEAPVLFAKACEMFILELTKRAWNHVEESCRRTLQKSDIFAAITRTDLFDFLTDLIPREDLNGLAVIGTPRELIPVGEPLTAVPPTFFPSQHMPPVGAPGMHVAAPGMGPGPSSLQPAPPIPAAQVPVPYELQDQQTSEESDQDDFLLEDPEGWKQAEE